MKICNKCNIKKELVEFSKYKKSKDLHAGTCKICKSKIDTEYRNLNKKTIRLKNLEYKAKNKEKLKIQNKEYYIKNQVEVYSKSRTYKKSRLEKTKEYGRNWEKRNPLKRREAGARYRARKLKAAVGYDIFKEQIKQIYLNCPQELHVDHIIPLAGENVCGLHVPWNLQYLTVEENSRKGNRYDYG